MLIDNWKRNLKSQEPSVSRTKKQFLYPAFTYKEISLPMHESMSLTK